MKILKGVGIVVVILVVLGTQKCFYSGGISEDGNVIVDNVAKVFHAPSHKFFEGELKDNPNLRVVTLKEAREMKYERDFVCEKSFEMEGESLIQVIVRQLQKEKKPN